MSYTMEISQIGLPQKVSNEIVSVMKQAEYKGPISVSALINNADLIKEKCSANATFELRTKLKKLGIDEEDVNCFLKKRGRQKHNLCTETTENAPAVQKEEKYCKEPTTLPPMELTPEAIEIIEDYIEPKVERPLFECEKEMQEALKKHPFEPLVEPKEEDIDIEAIIKTVESIAMCRKNIAKMRAMERQLKQKLNAIIEGI